MSVKSFALVCAAVITKLSTSMDDVLWLMPFISKGSKDVTEAKRWYFGVVYIAVNVTVTSLAIALSAGGRSLANALTSDGSYWDADRILGSISCVALFGFSMYLMYEELSEVFGFNKDENDTEYEIINENEYYNKLHKNTFENAYASDSNNNNYNNNTYNNNNSVHEYENENASESSNENEILSSHIDGGTQEFTASCVMGVENTINAIKHINNLPVIHAITKHNSNNSNSSVNSTVETTQNTVNNANNDGKNSTNSNATVETKNGAITDYGTMSLSAITAVTASSANTTNWSIVGSNNNNSSNDNNSSNNSASNMNTSSSSASNSSSSSSISAIVTNATASSTAGSEWNIVETTKSTTDTNNTSDKENGNENELNSGHNVQDVDDMHDTHDMNDIGNNNGKFMYNSGDNGIEIDVESDESPDQLLGNETTTLLSDHNYDTYDDYGGFINDGVTDDGSGELKSMSGNSSNSNNNDKLTTKRFIIIAIFGSLDEFAVQCALLLAKTFNWWELLCGIMIATFIVIALCLALSKVKFIVEIIEKIPLFLIILALAVFTAISTFV